MYAREFHIYVQSIRQRALIDELQLGSQLNLCTQNGDRAKFALLLSMLSSDISDQKQIETVVEKTKNVAQESARISRLNEYVASQNFAAMRLEICLEQEQSVAVGDHDFISQRVVESNSLLQQLKIGEANLIKPKLANEAETTTGQANLALPAAPLASTMLDMLNQYDPSKPLQIREPA